ncbi:MAG: GNAT family N-acetyltransferase [Planctomycetota bacterium]
MTVAIRPFDPEDLPEVVAWWNRAFADRRGFYPVTGELFQARVIGKKNAVEEFEPSRFLMARDGARVVGAAHVGVRSEEYCAAVFRNWPGGPQAYLAMIGVEPSARRQGIGGRLYAAAEAAVAGSGRLVIDGQCVNPFYGNSEAPFTPFFGTTEGISIPWEDSTTRAFFTKRGHTPRFRALSLEANLPDGGADLAWTEEAVKAGFTIDVLASRLPELGSALVHARRAPCETPYDAATIHREGIVCGVAVGYRMTQVHPARYAVYEVSVAEGLRGHGLGTAALAALLRNAAAKGVRQAEVLTVPELSKGAPEMYARMGFHEVASWAIY